MTEWSALLLYIFVMRMDSSAPTRRRGYFPYIHDQCFGALIWKASFIVSTVKVNFKIMKKADYII